MNQDQVSEDTRHLLGQWAYIFAVQVEPIASGVSYTVDALNGDLASRLLESALSAGCYAAPDEEEVFRIEIYYVTPGELMRLLEKAASFVS